MGPGSTAGTTVISEACLEGGRGEHLPDLGIGSDFSNQSQKVSTIKENKDQWDSNNDARISL